MFRYQVKTGILINSGNAVIGKGYSGHGEGLNNPAFEQLHDIGPTPRGIYIAELIADKDGNPIDYKHKSAPVFRLIPEPETNTFGRSGFLMHGHEKGEIIGKSETENSSLGCMVQEHATRVQVMIATDKRIHVL